MLKDTSLQHIDKDSLRKKPLSAQQKNRIETANKLATQKPQFTCVDTYAMIKTHFGYCPGITYPKLKEKWLGYPEKIPHIALILNYLTLMGFKLA